MSSAHLLLAYALFDADPRTAAARAPLRLFLVTLVLFEADDGLARADIATRVNEALPTEANIADPDVEASIDDAIELSLAQDLNGTVVLSAERRAEMAGSEARIRESKEALIRRLRAAIVSRLDRDIHHDEDMSAEGFELVLQSMFQERSVALARSLESGGFDLGLESLTKRKMSEVVEAVAGERLAALEAALVRAALEDVLRTLTPVESRYLAAIHQRTIAFSLLQQDPSIRLEKGRLASQRRGLLDTNVLIAWMFDDHPRHHEAMEAVDAARAVDAELSVSKFTIDELSFQLTQADDSYKRLESAGELLTIVDNDIVRTFAKRRVSHHSLSWTPFLASYSPPTAWLKENGVHTHDPEWARATLDERRAGVVDALAREKHTSAEVIRFDAHNLLHVQLLREHTPADEMGNRVWLVTLDSALARVERRLIADNVWQVPSAMPARDWTERLLACAHPDLPSLQEYAASVVRTQMGLIAEDPVFVRTSFLITLKEAEFDIDDLLAGSPARTRQVLIALQESADVRRVVGQREDSVQWRTDLRSAVRAALDGLERSVDAVAAEEAFEQRLMDLEQEARAARAQRDVLKREIAEARAELERERARVAELDDELRSARRGAFKRLLDRWFRGNQGGSQQADDV